jgi:acyl-CoA synthetase (AMP-forming)/AMP-acid ligase II
VNVADVITRHAEARPEAPAVVFGPRVLTYAAFERGVWVRAALLREAGVQAGEVVGIALRHSVQYLMTAYALARIGAIQVPLPMHDAPPLRRALAQRFGVRHIVGPKGQAGVPGVPVIRITRSGLAAARGRVDAALRVEGGDRPYAIWRTSGTTDQAKGVAITHRMLVEGEASRAMYYPEPEQDRYLAVIDMSLTFGFSGCSRAIINGGTIFLPNLAQLPPAQMLRLIDRYKITRLALTPNMFEPLLPLLPRQGPPRSPGIRDLNVIGMAIPEALRKEVRTRLTPGLIVLYGSNEARYVTRADAGAQEAYPETVGTPLNGIEVEVVDEEDRPVPRGTPGRIRARSPWMPKGYYNAPELDARTFRNGWVYLGDIGTLSPEGQLYISGRVDDMMNFDGIKIMPADIEAVLLAHPAVAEAIAFPVPSPRHQHMPVAAVTLRAAATEQALLRYCRERLGVRAPVRVLLQKEFPRNAMGKIARRELIERLLTSFSPRAPASRR